ncbi:MAG: right-handed parallel beta-helix repeat-containing protein [Phycisphaerales bacterium]|nr:right-handed parallel beta-helix repeat-containing protein [Phycisphaerales bacterium]
MRIAVLSLFAAGAALASQPTLTTEDLRLDRSSIDRIEEALPTVTVDRDDFLIDRSCIVRIPAGLVIEDANGDGVIHVVADGVVVMFEEGSVLRGRGGIDAWLSRATQNGDGWDTLTGTGIVVDGREGVEIHHANIRGYRNGIVATDAPGLVVRDTELVDMYRHRLTSTATREGSGDWLYPHNNDDNEWLTSYGAAIWAERCHGAHFEGVRVRRGQNGIILDNTNGATVTKNDCSFLSGWGLAMWRASQNTISENRFDFCVRGHVEGVYNRGQDSAGILMFEACTENTVVRNSCTHSGDGIFGFGGNDAVKTVTEGAWGNANNRFSSNDLSFSPAHGLEMTFSEGNRVQGNLFEGNAICGIWGGYSQGFEIAFNDFITNGGMAYGQERGGINIEHGADHSIFDNEFINNKVGVRLWWDHDESLLSQAGVYDRYKGVTGNKIFNNSFVMNDNHPFRAGTTLVGVEVLDIGGAVGFEGPRVGVNTFAADQNRWAIDSNLAERYQVDDGIEVLSDVKWPAGNWRISPPPERISPSGRRWIVCDEWGPWDFELPLLREHSRSGSADHFELYQPVGNELTMRVTINGAKAEIIEPDSDEGWRPWRLRVSPIGQSPISSYSGTVHIGDDWSRPISGRFISTTWNAKCWAWENDPLVDLEAWRAEAEGVEFTAIDQLDLPFGYNGPSRVNHALTVSERDRFGMIAETEIALPLGRWKLSTLSDDGIRVFVNGEVVIERWDIHGPTPDEVVFEVGGEEATRIRVEYFEHSGYATLGLDLQAVE